MADSKAEKAAKAKESAARAELAKWLGEKADLAYRPVEIDIKVPDGPMSHDEVDSLIDGLREIALNTNGRVRFYREASDLAGRLGRAAAKGAFL